MGGGKASTEISLHFPETQRFRWNVKDLKGSSLRLCKDKKMTDRVHGLCA